MAPPPNNTVNITIANCSNSATSGHVVAISSDTYAGGICGEADTSSKGEIEISNCSSSATSSEEAAAIQATTAAGGICGDADANATISNCYYLNKDSGGNQLGIGNKDKDKQTGTTALPADQMKAVANKKDVDGWEEIKVTYTDSNGNNISGKIALVDALNAWVDKNNNPTKIYLYWEPETAEPSYPVPRNENYSTVRFVSTLGYEISRKAAYETKEDTNNDDINIKCPGLANLECSSKSLNLSWDKGCKDSSNNSWSLNDKTKAELKQPGTLTITAQYKVGETVVENPSKQYHIIEVVDNETLEVVDNGTLEVVDNETLSVGVFEKNENNENNENNKNIVKIQASEKDSSNREFLCWVGNVDNDEDLEVLSYRKGYCFSARSDRTIIAVYEKDTIADALKDKGIADKKHCTNIESVMKLDGGGFKVISMCSVLDDYTVEYIGFRAIKLGGSSDTTTNSVFLRETELITDQKTSLETVEPGDETGDKRVVLAYKVEQSEQSKQSKPNAQLTWTNNKKDTNTWYLRSFVQCKKDNTETSELTYGDKIITIKFEGDKLTWSATPAQGDAN